MFDICTVVNFEVICTCTDHVHTWSVHVQIYLSCCVYAGSFMEFQCFEVKPEDDKPSTGMFAGSSEKYFSCVHFVAVITRPRNCIGKMLKNVQKCLILQPFTNILDIVLLNYCYYY